MLMRDTIRDRIVFLRKKIVKEKLQKSKFIQYNVYDFYDQIELLIVKYEHGKKRHNYRPYGYWCIKGKDVEKAVRAFYGRYRRTVNFTEDDYHVYVFHDNSIVAAEGVNLFNLFTSCSLLPPADWFWLDPYNLEMTINAIETSYSKNAGKSPLPAGKV
jgi:hypothetical protein